MPHISSVALLTACFAPELPGLDLKKLNLNLIQTGSMQVNVPLKSGYYSFPGLYEKACVSVKPGTIATMTVQIGKNSRQETVITRASIQLNLPIKIKNPSSACEASDGFNAFKDMFSSIHLNGIEVDSEGQVVLRGDIQKFFSKEEIQTQIKPGSFPKLDLRLESLKNKKVESGKMCISDLLTPLAEMLGQANCALKLHIDEPKTDLDFHAKAYFTRTGELKVKADPQRQSTAEFLGCTALLSGEVRVSKLAQSKPELDGYVVADMPQIETQMMFHDDDQVEIPVKIGQKDNHAHAKAQFQAGKPTQFSGDGLVDVYVESSKPVTVKGLGARFKQAHLHMEGHGQSAVAKAVISNPELRWRGFHGAVRGEMALKIKAKDLQTGTVSYKVASDFIRPFKRTVDYRLFPGNRVSLRAHNTGVNEFLDPANHMVWDPSSLCDPNSAPVGDIGSVAWRTHVEQLTRAPIRKQNRVRTLIDGKTAFEERIKLIQNAKKTICLQTLVFKDDETGMATARALVEAHQRGVDVKVIVDTFGNLESVKELIRGHKVYEFLEKNGVQLKLYSNEAAQGMRDVFDVIDRDRVSKGLTSLKEMVDLGQTFSVLNLFAKLASGTLNLGLSNSDQAKVAGALKKILGSSEQADLTVQRLAHLTPEHPLELAEALQIWDLMENLNHRWHEKYFVVDGKTAILGGRNIGDEYLKGIWRDTDVLIEGEAVHEAYECFARNWKTVSGQEIDCGPMSEYHFEDPVELQVIQSRPHHDLGHPITNFKIESIKALKPGDKLYEATAYFMPIGALKPYVEALKNAAARGVDVRILTNSKETTDMKGVSMAAMGECYADLLESGVRIFERTGNQTMHQKTGCYGTQLALVGSANLDNRGDSLNSEDLVVIHSVEHALEFENMLLRDMQPDVARELQLAEVESFPIALGLVQNAYAMGSGGM